MKKIIAILVFSLIIGTLFTITDGVEPLKIKRLQTNRYGGTLKVAIHNDIETLNPLAANDAWTWKVLGRMYETPILIDPDGKVVPHVAIGSGDEPDKLFGYDWDLIKSEYNPRNITVTYDFTGVMFHDGVQMTIDDIIFSYHVLAQVPMFMGDFNCLKDKNGESGSNFTATHWLGLTKINDTALHFNLSTNFTLFFEKTLAVMILPQHIWDQFGNPTLPPTELNAFNLSAAQSWDNPNPIGSGPFKFIEWSPGLYINLATYLEYCEGRNLIDGILFRIYKTADAAVMALKGGDMDYVSWSIVPDWVDDLITKRNISLSFEDYPFFSYLSFNMRKSPCNDTAFRRAVAHCVNKDLVVDVLLQNYGVVGDGPVNPNNTFWYNTSLPQYTYDPQMAKLILDLAGYIDMNGDGWRDMPNGSSINIKILTPPADYDPILSAVGLMIASNMQQVGINVLSKPMMFNKLLDARNNHSFDMYILEWGIEELNHWNMKCEDPDYLYDLFYSANSEKGKNYQGYNNTIFDQKMLLSRTGLNDTIRRESINETQGIVASDLPNIYLFYRTNIEARRSDRFINWEVVSSTIFNYWSLHGIYLKSDFIPPSASTWLPTGSLVSPDANFTVKWNETMDWGSVNDSFSYTNGTYVWTSTDGVFFHNPLTNTSTFNPKVDLNPTTIHTVMFNSTIATDVEKNKLDQNKNGVGGQGFFFGDDLVWSFTTKEVTPPMIISVNPPDLAINVSVTTNVVVIFNEPMNKTATEEAFTLETSIVFISGTFSWNTANDTMTFNPITDLAGEIIYRINVTTSANDLVGNALSTHWSSLFRTEDITPPTVSSTLPTIGQVNVLINTNITITFSEAMNKTAVQNAILISDELIPISISWSNEDTSVTFTPYPKLNYDAQYNITIDAEMAEDIAGNKLDGDKDRVGGDNYSWSFITEIGTGTISGTIKDNKGNSVPNTTVTIYYTNGTIAGTTNTDDNGNYAIDVPPGTYDVKIEKSGYETQWKKNIVVTTDQTSTTDLTLPLSTDILRDYWWAILLIIIITVILIMIALIVKWKKPVEEEGKEEKVE